jgi:nitroreductase
MELMEAIRARRSVRSFENRSIEPKQLETVLSLATEAPSASNLQAYQIYVVRDADKKEALSMAALGQEFMANAPVLLVFCADLSRAHAFGHVREQNYSPQDTIIAMAYAQLAATDLGLASCWVGAFDERETARVLNLPDTQRPIAIMPIGYAAETPSAIERRPLSELIVDKG